MNLMNQLVHFCDERESFNVVHYGQCTSLLQLSAVFDCFMGFICCLNLKFEEGGGFFYYIGIDGNN